MPTQPRKGLSNVSVFATFVIHTLTFETDRLTVIGYEAVYYLFLKCLVVKILERPMSSVLISRTSEDAHYFALYVVGVEKRKKEKMGCDE
jgi:hypothetical protein